MATPFRVRGRIETQEPIPRAETEVVTPEPARAYPDGFVSNMGRKLVEHVGWDVLLYIYEL